MTNIGNSHNGSSGPTILQYTQSPDGQFLIPGCTLYGNIENYINISCASGTYFFLHLIFGMFPKLLSVFTTLFTAKYVNITLLN